MLPRRDLHTHSTHSDGHQTIEEIFREAQRRKLEVVAVTDHANTSNSDYESASDVEYIKNLKDQCNSLCRGTETRLLIGVEAEIIDVEGSLNISPEIAGEFDFVIASLHVIPRESSGTIEGDLRAGRRELAVRCIRSEIAAIKSGSADVLGHPMYTATMGRYLKTINDYSGNILTELAEAAAKHDVAVEVNGHFYRDITPPTGYSELFRICLENSVKLSTGSDAHQWLHVGALSGIHDTLKRLNTKPSDLYTPELK